MHNENSGGHGHLRLKTNPSAIGYYEKAELLRLPDRICSPRAACLPTTNPELYIRFAITWLASRANTAFT